MSLLKKGDKLTDGDLLYEITAVEDRAIRYNEIHLDGEVISRISSRIGFEIDVIKGDLVRVEVR